MENQLRQIERIPKIHNGIHTFVLGRSRQQEFNARQYHQHRVHLVCTEFLSTLRQRMKDLQQFGRHAMYVRHQVGGIIGEYQFDSFKALQLDLLFGGINDMQAKKNETSLEREGDKANIAKSTHQVIGGLQGSGDEVDGGILQMLGGEYFGWGVEGEHSDRQKGRDEVLLLVIST